MEKHLHIVCLDVPYPVDYGGVFDLFYKIKTLHALGIQIHLHCFEYGRGQQTELEKYCTEVHYYARKEGHKGFSTDIPYIVASRSSTELVQNLQKDDYPVLMEGIHCTYPLYSGALENRKTILRLHNVENEYYYKLSCYEKSLLKKAYYYNETRLLKPYEHEIAGRATQVLAVAEKDAASYRQHYDAPNTSYLPVFIPYQEVRSLPGLGTYCLYHGNLSITENEKAAIWMLENIFDRVKLPFVIAGKNPTARLERLVYTHAHTCLVANPSESEMDDLIAKAQINILPSFNPTGVKLKLLHALFNGRHCVVNPETVAQTGLDPACHTGPSAEALRELVQQLYYLPFAEEDISLRETLLCGHYDNERNGQKLIDMIW